MIAAHAIARGSLLAAGSGASFVRGLGPAAWFRFNTGITDAGGGLCSQWADQSGNARHLKQGTGTNQPAIGADGTITFDGVDNFLKCDAFTLNQPFSMCVLVNQVTWALNDVLFDGNTTGVASLFQRTGSPALAITAGTTLGNVSPAVNTWHAIAAVFNGANSVLQLDQGTPVTGNAGASNAAGFTLGANGNGAGAFANCAYKEVIVFASALSTASIARVVRYLGQVGQLGI